MMNNIILQMKELYRNVWMVIISYWAYIIKISLLQQALHLKVVCSSLSLLLIGWKFLAIKLCVMNSLWLIWNIEVMVYRRDSWMLL